MKAKAYYNEHDPFAAAWLRELIKAGLIAPGEVDERSIEDVAPADLDGFCQVHLFAGIGVWSWALRCAGWPDDWDVWSISCPCQPFSAAGKGAGFADERHLWPAAFHLLRARRPVTIVGEQVASADGLTWLDLVFSDLEGEAYACGAVDTCAAGFGAPHIRQRLYWVADLHRERLDGQPVRLLARGQEQARAEIARSGGLGLLAYSMPAGWPEGRPWAGRGQAAGLRGLGGVGDTTDLGLERREPLQGQGARNIDAGASPACGLAHTSGGGSGAGLCHCGQAEQRGPFAPDNGAVGWLAESTSSECCSGSGGYPGEAVAGRAVWPDADGCCGVVPGREGEEQAAFAIDLGHTSSQGLPHGESQEFQGARGGPEGRATGQSGRSFWADCIWLPCRDGKARPVEPGTFPLAHGAAARVGRLRGYGNALVAPQAEGFVRAYMEVRANYAGALREERDLPLLAGAGEGL